MSILCTRQDNILQYKGCGNMHGHAVVAALVGQKASEGYTAVTKTVVTMRNLSLAYTA